MNVLIRPYEPDDIATAYYIANNARAEDVTEANAFGVTIPQFTAALAQRHNGLDHTWLTFVDGKPAFIFGFTGRGVDTYQVWGFGTKASSHTKVIAKMSAYIRDIAIPDMLAHGAAEAHVVIPLTNPKSIRWLMSLGWKIFDYTTLWPKGAAAVQLIWNKVDHVFYPTQHRHGASSYR